MPMVGERKENENDCSRGRPRTMPARASMNALHCASGFDAQIFSMLSTLIPQNRFKQCQAVAKGFKELQTVPSC